MLVFSDSKTISCAAGEGILFELQLCDWAGNVQPLVSTQRTFALAVYDTANEYIDCVGQTLTDASGDFCRFQLDGTHSQALRGLTGLTFEVSEQLSSSTRDVLMTGTLTVNNSAPTIATNPNAPLARYITRVSRLFDPILHGVSPVYQFTVETYFASGVAPPVSNLVTDFSNPCNSVLVCVF